MNIDVPMQKYATFRLVFHCIYAWQRLTAPISGIHTLIAYTQISNICNIPKTTMDRLTAIDIIVTILCIKGTSFHFDFIEKPPFLQILIYRSARLPILYHTPHILAIKKTCTDVQVFWLGWKDLNPRNNGVRVRCLTAWRHPSICAV